MKGTKNMDDYIEPDFEEGKEMSVEQRCLLHAHLERARLCRRRGSADYKRAVERMMRYLRGK